ncbi:hypothetical protein I6A84_34225, partial [Frankia sp. CNm7]|nr:hypothetical protein [Frankia nepalensis]
MSITDSDLRARLRALPADLPQRAFRPALPDVRAGARRPRARARVAAAAALVVLVTAGVGIPAGVLTGSRDSVVPATSRPASSFGGFSVTWLPDGLTHKANSAAFEQEPYPFAWGPVDASGRPLPMEQVMRLPGRPLSLHARAEPTTFASLFTAEEATNPSSVWVSVTWQPRAVMTVDLMAAEIRNGVNGEAGQIDVTRDAVAGRPALVLRLDTATATATEPG